MWPFNRKRKDIEDLALNGYKRAVEFDEAVNGEMRFSRDPFINALCRDIDNGGPFSRLMEKNYGLKRR